MECINDVFQSTIALVTRLTMFLAFMALIVSIVKIRR